MKPSTQDKIEGKLHEVKGTIKEEIGRVTKNPNMEGEGRRKDRRQGSKVDRPR